ncbi:Fe-S protein assembly co-chaperone HscB [soil metagenome]
MQNHFDLFHLPQRYAIDQGALDSAFHEVQNQVHPDKFVSASAAEKRVAMQWATRANEAYQTLKKPLQRARYLCELNGVDLQIESNTAMPREFLLQQMEWREALEDAKAARDVDAMDALERELMSTKKDTETRIGALLDAANFVDAGQQVRLLMFLEKFREELADSFPQ